MKNEDFILFRAGYNRAVFEITNILNNNTNIEVIKDEILRKQRALFAGNEAYEGNLYKYYDKENNLGYILFDDIYELKGVCIFIKEGIYTELPVEELLFAKQNNKLIQSESFTNKDLATFRYQEWLSKFSHKA